MARDTAAEHRAYEAAKVAREREVEARMQRESAARIRELERQTVEAARRLNRSVTR